MREDLLMKMKKTRKNPGYRVQALLEGALLILGLVVKVKSTGIEPLSFFFYFSLPGARPSFLERFFLHCIFCSSGESYGVLKILYYWPLRRKRQRKSF
jgi:hypothetical protein